MLNVHDFERAFVKALGIELANLQKLELVLEAGELPVVTATYSIYGNDGHNLGAATEVMEKFKFMKAKDEPLA